MPEWISVWVTKILGSEPVVKIMYVLLVWVAVLIVSPNSIAIGITERSGIPYSGQVVQFALAFVIVDALQRAIRKIESIIKAKDADRKESESKKNKRNELIESFNLLDSSEKEILSKFYLSGSNTLWLPVKDVSVRSLQSKKFIYCMHGSRFANSTHQMTYSVSDKYAAFLKDMFLNSKTEVG